MVDMFNVCYFEKDYTKAKSPYISPVYASTEQLKTPPPALLILADCDSFHEEGALYGRILKESGVVVETHEFEDSIHEFTLYGKEDAKRGWAVMAEFIKYYSLL